MGQFDCTEPEAPNVWECKVGFTARKNLPDGADAPMREAVARAYAEITNEEPDFVSSGWCSQLTTDELKALVH